MSEGEYKMDSTRGTSLIQPLNYKGDVLSQVWIDSRVLATLTVWMEKIGRYPRFMSEIVRVPLEVLVEHLVESEQVKMVDDTVEARDILARRFKVDLSRGGRGGKNILHNKVLSEERGELANRVARPERVDDMRVGSKSAKHIGTKFIPIEEYPDYYYPEGDEDTKNRLIEKIKAMGVKSKSEICEEAIRNAKASGLIVEEPNVKEGMSEEEFYRKAKERDEEVMKRENSPVDIEWLKKNAGVKG